MDIRGISGIFGKMSEPPDKTEGKKAESTPQETSQSDSVELSSQAQAMGKLLELTEAAMESPDIRADKVAEIKAKLKSGEIPSPESDRATAEAFLKSLSE